VIHTAQQKRKQEFAGTFVFRRPAASRAMSPRGACTRHATEFAAVAGRTAAPRHSDASYQRVAAHLLRTHAPSTPLARLPDGVIAFHA